MIEQFSELALLGNKITLRAWVLEELSRDLAYFCGISSGLTQARRPRG